MKADGSDIVTVIAAIADENGNIKRLNNYEVKFEIEGQGQLVADEATFTNPRPVLWGTAPVLVRSTTTPGEIKIRTSVVWQGKHTPVSSELVIHTFPSEYTLITNKLNQQTDVPMKKPVPFHPIARSVSVNCNRN